MPGAALPLLGSTPTRRTDAALVRREQRAQSRWVAVFAGANAFVLAGSPDDTLGCGLGPQDS